MFGSENKIHLEKSLSMNKEEKEVLKKVRDDSGGLLSQSDLINYLPNRDTRLSHSLITSGFIEEVNRKIKATQIEATFYRLTEKGRIIFEPFYKRLWFLIKGDIRIIIVAAITALIISIISKMISQ